MSGQWAVTMRTVAGDLTVNPTDLAATLALVEAALINDVPVDIDHA